MRTLPLLSAMLLMLVALAPAFGQEQPKIEGPGGTKVYVNIAQSADLIGNLSIEALKVITSFGEVSIPFSDVVGIKMNIDKDSKAVIAFKNGDMVTGNVELKTLILTTTWGEAHIAPANIETIMVDKNGRFYEDRTVGGWRFSKAVETTTPPANRATTPTNNRQFNTIPQRTVPNQFGQ